MANSFKQTRKPAQKQSQAQRQTTSQRHVPLHLMNQEREETFPEWDMPEETEQELESIDALSEAEEEWTLDPDIHDLDRVEEVFERMDPVVDNTGDVTTDEMHPVEPDVRFAVMALNREADEGFTVEPVFPPSLGYVTGNPTQAHQKVFFLGFAHFLAQPELQVFLVNPCDHTYQQATQALGRRIAPGSTLKFNEYLGLMKAVQILCDHDRPPFYRREAFEKEKDDNEKQTAKRRMDRILLTWADGRFLPWARFLSASKSGSQADAAKPESS